MVGPPVFEKPSKGHFRLAGKEFPRLKWWTVPKMRILYFYIFALIATNTNSGFNSSMMNGLQSLVYWQEYFNHPTGSILGMQLQSSLTRITRTIYVY